MPPHPTSNPNGPQIPRFYAGRSIFITGATGFMGKVLIERLLSTCPDVGRLYLLMRPKRGVLPNDRLLQLKQSQVFDVVRERSPRQLDKLVLIAGDVTLPQLGMTQEALAQLQEVSLVFHSAATLKFDEALRAAVDQNVRSVMRLLDICDRLPNLQALVHVSTAYSNAELDRVEERVYPAPAPLDELLALADSAPPHLLAEITQKYIHPKPNTYTFTKAIAENVISQRERRYAAAIFRPTIVVSSLQHPFPGWIENLNGPSGVVVGIGKGMLHVFCCRSGAKTDLLPVDMAIDTLLAVGWETAVDKTPEVRVYNCSTCENPTNWKEFKVAILKYLRQHPLDQVLWYPSGTTVQNRYAEKALEVLLQTVPLYLAEYAARLLGIKTRLSLITADKKLRSMSAALLFFAQKEWHFDNSNVRRLRARLSPEDARIYNLDPNTIDWEEHYSNFVKGTRRYLLKEKDQDMETARKHLRRMGYLHYSMLFLCFIITARSLLRIKFVQSALSERVRQSLSFFFTLYSRITA